MESPGHPSTWRKVSLQLPCSSLSDWAVDSAWFSRKLPATTRKGSHLGFYPQKNSVKRTMLRPELTLSVTPGGVKVGESGNTQSKALPRSPQIRSQTFRKRLFEYVSRSKYSCKAQRHWAVEALAYREVGKLVHHTSRIDLKLDAYEGDLRIKTAEMGQKRTIRRRWNQQSGGETPLTPWKAPEF